MEDDPIIAEDLLRTLSSDGYGVVTGFPEIFTNTAGFPDSIDQIISREQISLILMDINLDAHLDGVDLVKHIQQKWHIPVIYVTGQCDAATISRAWTTEPVAYVRKPFAAHELKLHIQRALAVHPSARNAKAFFLPVEE